MICTVYWCKDGFILVPDCMKASRASEERYGPLSHCGSIDTDQLPPDLASRIESEIEHELFASLRSDLAIRLGYQATPNLRLPDGFQWRESDWWSTDGERQGSASSILPSSSRPGRRSNAGPAGSR